MKDIKNTTQKKYTDYSKTPGSPDNDFLFMYSVARWVKHCSKDCFCLSLIRIALMNNPQLTSLWYEEMWVQQ